MNCIINPDGSISIRCRNHDLIRNMYPGVDGRSIRAMKTTATDRKVLWETADGTICCHITEEGAESAELSFSLQSWKEKIHTFSFLYQTDIEIKGFYQAAEGMGGDTGYYSVRSLTRKRNLASYGLCSLDFGDCALTIYSTMSTASDGTPYSPAVPADCFRYETVFELDAYQREKYTDGWADTGMETVTRLSCGARLERTNQENVIFSALRFLVTDTVEAGLNQAAEAIGKAMHARLQKPPAYHWCSWYYCYHNFDMPQLREYLKGLNQMEEKIPVRYIQIDAGYSPAVGDWLLPNERFPNGLKEAFREIREAGYLPGIWIGPFMVGNRSRLYREHPDWILYDLENRPVRPMITDNEPKPMGYQDEEYYVLDTSHPDAMEYLHTVFASLRSWGAALFKTDFMLWGFIDSSRVRRHTPGKTSVEYFRDFLRMIRETIGEESYWLGCIAPFLPFVGYADGMRVGGDVGSRWEGEYGPQNMLRSLVGNNYLNHSYFQIDPDAVMLRNFHIRLTDREINSLALLAAVSGSCIYTSDPLHRLSEDRRKLFHFIRPDEKRRKPSLPFLAGERPEIVMTHREGDKGLVFIFNKTDEWLKESYALPSLGFPEGWHAFRFDTGEEEELWKNQIIVALPPHACRLLLLTSRQSIVIDRSNLWKNLD